jgi:hypothetical protein
MRKSSSGQAGQAIERILELSADAQIARRIIGKDSPALPQSDGSDSNLRQSPRASHSTSTAGRILHSNQ